MTRRYTGAEARELRRGVGPFEVSGVVIVNAHPAAAIRCVADINDQTLGPLLAAAPDLAESLAAVEAERDALSRALFLSDAARDNEESAYLALLAERDALRAAVLECFDAMDAIDTDRQKPHTSGWTERRDALHAKLSSALAALREAAK